MGTPIFKLVAASAWEEACRDGVFAGSAADKRDGFIHLSASHRVAETAARHFHGQEDLLLVAFDADTLGPELRWEPSRGGDLFPHFYAPLPVAAALWTRPLLLGQDGFPEIPRDLVGC